MSDQPKISVVMSVYNAAADLSESIESILTQSFKDFEFIIINDGSTDNSQEILEECAKKDKRIRLVNQENTGLTKALNNALKLAKGEYIARQDCDDKSYPKRFELQIKVLDKNENIGLVGGNCDDLYEDGSMGIWGTHEEDVLQKIVYLKTPFPHSTIMMRGDLCHKLGGYDERFKTSQDMELWMRFAKISKLAMIAEPIIQRKICSGSISQKRRWRQFYDAMHARMIHNRGIGRVKAVYYGLRSFIINMLPPSFIHFLKRED